MRPNIRYILPVRSNLLILWGLVGSLCLIGCEKHRDWYLRDAEVGDFRKVATSVDYPDVDSEPSPLLVDSLPPRTIDDRGDLEFWDLPLQEAIRLTLNNGEVLRGALVREIRGRFREFSDAPSIYDTAIGESDPRFGVQAALAAFDANFTTGMTWSRDDRPLNNGVIVGQFPASASAFIFQQDRAAFSAELSKLTAVGSSLFVRNAVDYRLNNVPSNLFPSSYSSGVEFGIRQPLLQGMGTEFNRIAGPRATPGFFFSSGILIARINNDIAIADFELSVRDTVSIVEDAYWELYFAYRNLDAQVSARDSALETWRVVKAKFDEGARGGSLGEEAQAREQYFSFRAAVESSLVGTGANNDSTGGGLYGIEANLRRLMGLPINDGKLIRPSDHPVVAPVRFDWSSTVRESLANRTILRQQKWRIKQRELELVAAKNFLLPRLDLTALYRVNGFGDRLLASDSDNDLFQNATETLTGGQFADWQLGLQLDVPIGFRRAWAGVRNAELQVSRARAILKNQEEDVVHNLGRAIRDLDASFTQTKTHYNRLIAAEDRVHSERSRYEEGVITLDLLLESQELRARAESDYFRSLLNYQQGVKRLQLEKGTLLAHNSIFLSEGEWPDEAYADSLDRERERAHARPWKLGKTEPEPFVRGSEPEVTSEISLQSDGAQRSE
ncbi:MAG: TolC family protein [Planctomycetota bacterium]|nr:TolC family protein [Planctomycetota bacterium]